MGSKHTPIPTTGANSVLPFFIGGGEMGKRIRAFDWSSTSLGSPEKWPAHLRLAIDFCLNSHFSAHIWWGSELIYLYNDAHIPVLGKRHGGALGKPATEVWKDIWPLLSPQVKAVMDRGESTWNRRVRVVLDRNEYPEETWFTWNYSPIRDEAGQVGGLMCVAIEETAAVHAERERDRIAELRRQALDTITDFAYVFDLQGRFTFVNRPLLALWGLELHEAAGKDFFDLKYPDDLAAKLQRQIQQVIKTRQRLVDETPYTSPTGAGGYYQYIFTPVIGADGKVEAVAGSTRDISEQKHAQAALRRSREQLEVVVKEANVGVWYCPLPFGKLIWDAKVKEHFHLSPEAEVTIDTFYERLHPDDHARARGAMEISISQRLPYDIDYRTVSADRKKVKWIRANGRAFYDAQGHAIAFDGVTIDITERRVAEEASRQAREAAEAANRAKDKFLAVLSHELHTPLSPIVMTVPALESDPDMPHKFRQDLAMIRRNVDLEVKLIDDLLDLSRVVSGKLHLQMQSVRAHEVLRHSFQNSLGDSAGKKQVILQKLDAADDRLMADPARLQQVFWNLIRNATKFTGDSGRITVHTSNRADNGRLRIEIIDTGIGIPAEALPRIFDAFEQGGSRVTQQFGGLGLGLAIAKAVVEMHGGTISASSAGSNLGATFTIELGTVAAEPAVEAPNPVGGDVPSARSIRTRVLLVEDHPDTSDMMSRLLKASGFEVRTARSVATALQSAAAEPFDVLISDIGLPDATGYELMRQIRDRHAMKGITLSGYGMEEDVRKSHEAGFSEHLVKPINISQLDAALRRVTQS